MTLIKSKIKVKGEVFDICGQESTVSTYPGRYEIDLTICMNDLTCEQQMILKKIHKKHRDIELAIVTDTGTTIFNLYKVSFSKFLNSRLFGHTFKTVESTIIEKKWWE